MASSDGTYTLPETDASKWVLGRMQHTQWSKFLTASEAVVFQALPVFHAAMKIQDSGAKMNETARHALTAKQYEEWSAMAFLLRYRWRPHLRT